MRKRPSGSVYRITNTITGRQYIGLTMKSYGTRWCSHRNLMLNGQHPCTAMTADLVAHGIDSFVIEQIEPVDDPETARQREWHWAADALAKGIELYNRQVPCACSECGRKFMGIRGAMYCSAYRGCCAGRNKPPIKSRLSV